MLEREYSTKKIDSAGRITLPKNLRVKYDYLEGEEVEFLTLKRNGLTYLCITLSKELEARLEEEDLEILLSFDGGKSSKEDS